MSRFFSLLLPWRDAVTEEIEVPDWRLRGASKNGFECSVCGDRVEDADEYEISGTFNFCPCCGRKVMQRCS